MSTKSLSWGIIFPKVTSETKIAITKVSASSSSSRKAVVLPRAFSSSKSFFGSFSFSFMVPAVSILSVAMIMGLLVFHLFVVNAYSTKGSELKKHQSAVIQLTDQQKRLMVQQAEVASISKVSETARNLGLVPITKEEYIVSNQFTQR